MVTDVANAGVVQPTEDTLLSIGGTDSRGAATDLIQEYNAVKKTWSLRPEKMLVGKKGASVIVPIDWCDPPPSQEPENL